MTGLLRVQYPGALYHFMNRGRCGDEILTEAKDYFTSRIVDEVFGSTARSSIDRVKYEMRRDKGMGLRVEELIKILGNRPNADFLSVGFPENYGKEKEQEQIYGR